MAAIGAQRVPASSIAAMGRSYIKGSGKFTGRP